MTDDLTQPGRSALIFSPAPKSPGAPFTPAPTPSPTYGPVSPAPVRGEHVYNTRRYAFWVCSHNKVASFAQTGGRRGGGIDNALPVGLAQNLPSRHKFLPGLKRAIYEPINKKIPLMIDKTVYLSVRRFYCAAQNSGLICHRRRKDWEEMGNGHLSPSKSAVIRVVGAMEFQLLQNENLGAKGSSILLFLGQRP